MLLHVARSNAVDRVNRAPLKLIEVARDNFGSLLDIWDHNGDLVTTGELSQALPNSVAYLEVSIRVVLAAELANHPIKVKDEEVLIGEPRPSFEEKASKDI